MKWNINNSLTNVIVFFFYFLCGRVKQLFWTINYYIIHFKCKKVDGLSKYPTVGKWVFYMDLQISIITFIKNFVFIENFWFFFLYKNFWKNFRL